MPPSLTLWCDGLSVRDAPTPPLKAPRHRTHTGVAFLAYQLTSTPMERLRTIVTAVDFTDGSARAVVRAADLAERLQAQLHLVHADVLFKSDGLFQPDGESRPQPEHPGSVLRVAIERFAAKALGVDAEAFAALLPVIAIVRDVTAAAALVRYAEEVEADLLVMGTHGRSGVSRLMLGSVAEEVVRHAPCPVLTVPHRAPRVVPHASAPILAPVDFSEHSIEALWTASQLARLYGAPLELVHVIEEPGPYPAFYHEALTYQTAKDITRGVQERTESELKQVAAQACIEPSAIHVRVGRPAQQIIEVAEERGAAMIVMATRGLTGLASIFMGSVTEKTLRHTPCPILTLKKADVWRAAPAYAARQNGTNGAHPHNGAPSGARQNTTAQRNGSPETVHQNGTAKVPHPEH